MQEGKSYFLPLSEISYSRGMDAVRKLLIEKADDAGETLASLSKKVGKNHAYLQQFVRRGIPVRLPEEVRRKLAGILRVSEADLGAPAGHIAPPVPAHASNENLAIPPHQPDEIPLYGQILGGKLDAVPFDDEVAGSIPRPHYLQGVHGAYAAYVVGDSMEPRYNAGEVVFVNPRHPPQRGKDVAVQVQNEEGGPILLYIKTLVSAWPSKSLRLMQYNPKRVIEYPASKVKAVHRVLGREDR